MRASVSRSRPRAHAICDRCGFRYNHDQLQWQTQWAGPKLQNLRLLVCKSCLDIPNEQLRTIILPPDPVPIRDPRPEISTQMNTSLREDTDNQGTVEYREDGSLELEETNTELVLSLRDAYGVALREAGGSELEERSEPIAVQTFQQ